MQSFAFSSFLCRSHTAGAPVVHAGVIYSVVDARIRAFSVREHRSWCLPFEAECSIAKIFISADGKLLAAVDARGLATLLSAKTGQIIQRDIFDLRPIKAMSFSQNNEFVCVATPDDIRLYRTNLPELQTGKSHAFCASIVMARDTNSIQTLKFSHDDTTLFCLKKDGALLALPVGLLTQRSRVKTASRAKQLKKMFPQDPVEVVIQEQIIDFFPYPNKNINIFELADNLCDHSLTQQQVELINEQFSNQRMFTSDILIVGRNGYAAVFEAGGAAVADDEPQPCYNYIQTNDFQIKYSDTEENGKDVMVTGADFSAQHNQLAVCTASGDYILYETTHNQFIHTVSCTPYPLTAVKIMSDAQICVTSTYEQYIRVFNHLTETFELSEPSFNPTCMAMSPDGLLLATGSNQGMVYIYNTVSQLRVLEYQAHNGPVKQLDFFKSNKAIASVSTDKITCYDLNKQIIFRELHTELNSFEKVSVESSGEILAAADQFNNISIFDLQKSSLVDTFPAHAGPITKLEFLCDGSGVLLSSSWDKTLRMTNCFSESREAQQISENKEILGFCVLPLQVVQTNGQMTQSRQVMVYLSDGSQNIYSLEDMEQRDYFNVRRHFSYRLRQLNDSGKLLCAAIAGQLLVGGGKSRYLLIYDQQSRQLIQRLQLSINNDYDGVDPDREGRVQTTFDRQKLLEAQTKALDLKTRKIVDPILQLERKRPECKCLDVALSRDAGQLIVLTPFGALTYTVQSGIQSNQFDLNLTYDSVREGLGSRPEVAIIQACALGSQELFDMALTRMAQLKIESAPNANEHLGVFLNYFCQYYQRSCFEQDKALVLRILQGQLGAVAKSLISQKQQYAQRHAISGLQAVGRTLANDAEVVQVLDDTKQQSLGVDLLLQGRQLADVEEQLVDFRVEIKQRELATKRKREEEERKREQRRRRQ